MKNRDHSNATRQLFTYFNVKDYNGIVTKIYGDKIFPSDAIKKKFNSLFYHIEKKLVCQEDKHSAQSYLIQEAFKLKNLTSPPKNLKHLERVLKKKVDNHIKEQKFTTLQTPIIINSERKQRRADSLARLLSLDFKHNPCVAVALIDKKLVVALNSIHSNNFDKEREKLTTYITNKFQLLQSYLHLVDSEKEKFFEIQDNKIIFTEKGKNQARDVVRELQQEINGGADGFQSHRPKQKHTSMHERLQVDLLKLAASYLLSKRSRGSDGEFSRNQLKALDAQQFTLLTSSYKKLQASLHAEQAIALYKDENAPNAQINIGISKLSCGTCTKVLNNNEDLSYRGSHGQFYPNVLDVNTVKVHSPLPTKAENTYPNDSSSDEERELSRNGFFGLPSPLESPTARQVSQAMDMLFPAEHDNKNCKQSESQEIYSVYTASLTRPVFS